MKKGSTRYIFFIGKFVFKIPSLYTWKNFLWGLLANIQETEFSKVDKMKEKLCPIKFTLPLGILVVMPKVRILKDNELTKDELTRFCTDDGFTIPSELKCDSFGYLNGKLVSVDYG